MKYRGSSLTYSGLFVVPLSNWLLSSAVGALDGLVEVNLVKQMAQHISLELPAPFASLRLLLGPEPGRTGKIREGRVSYFANSLKFMFNK